jgi:hypothetical protein
VHDNTETGIASQAGNRFNSVPFAVDDLPELTESAPSRLLTSTQAVMLPILINGRISRPGEGHVFQFQGRAGQKIVAEVFARRLDSPLDSFLRLTRPDGKQLAFNDDFEDKGSGLNTHHADSYLRATLPADGTYSIHLTDTQGKGGPQFAYRLRLSEPRPDFALRLVPSSLSLRAAMSGPVTVFALRRDGFTNAIDLALKDAPEGFSISGARIAEGQDKARFTIQAPARAAGAPAAVSIEGRALIGGEWVSHPAVPAEDLMQAFIYRHLVSSAELAVLVAGPDRPFLRDAFRILGETRVRIPRGGKASVRITAPGAFSERFKLELSSAPAGISLASVSPVPGGLEMVFACDAAKVKPGAGGNLICAILPNKPAGAGSSKKAASAPPRGAEATLPAIPFKIEAE